MRALPDLLVATKGAIAMAQPPEISLVLEER
jgi:hypothetical protein